MVRSAHDPAPIGGPENLDSHRRIETLDPRRGRSSRDQRQGLRRRITEERAPGPFGIGDPRWLGQQCSLQNLVLWLSGLNNYPPATGTRTDHSRGADEQCHRLLGSAIARSEEFLIEIEECDHLGLMHTMQRRFGTHDDSRSCPARISPALGGEFRNRLAHERFELLAHPIDTGAEILHPCAAASGAEQRSDFVAAETHEAAVLALHNGCFTALAGGDLTTRHTR